MFLPLISLKNKLCTLPPHSLSWRRVFPLISLPLLIHKQRIYNPVFETRFWNWKEIKFSPSSTRLEGCALTAVSHGGWTWASHQARGTHRLKILSHLLSSSILSKSMPEQKRESHSLFSDTMERKDRRAKSIPYFHYIAYTQTQWCQDFLVAWTRLKNINLPSIYSVHSSSDEHRQVFVGFFFFFNENISPVQTAFAQLAWISLHLMPSYLN